MTSTASSHGLGSDPEAALARASSGPNAPGSSSAQRDGVPVAVRPGSRARRARTAAGGSARTASTGCAVAGRRTATATSRPPPVACSSDTSPHSAHSVEPVRRVLHVAAARRCGRRRPARRRRRGSASTGRRRAVAASGRVRPQRVPVGSVLSGAFTATALAAAVDAPSAAGGRRRCEAKASTSSVVEVRAVNDDDLGRQHVGRQRTRRARAPRRPRR